MTRLLILPGARGPARVLVPEPEDGSMSEGLSSPTSRLPIEVLPEDPAVAWTPILTGASASFPSSCAAPFAATDTFVSQNP